MRIEKNMYNRKRVMKDNPFSKEVTIKNSYAVYLSPDRLIEYNVLKTYTHPNREHGDSVWLVAERPIMFMSLDDYELKKIRRGDVNCHSFMVSCSKEWEQSYIN